MSPEAVKPDQAPASPPGTPQASTVAPLAAAEAQAAEPLRAAEAPAPPVVKAAAEAVEPVKAASVPAVEAPAPPLAKAVSAPAAEAVEAPAAEPPAPEQVTELSGPSSPDSAPELAGPSPPPPAKARPEVPPERIAAELKELEGLVNSLDSLSFLKARVGRCRAEGADLLTLASIYRLMASSLKDEAAQARMAADQYRKEFEKMRARVTKMELEFAVAVEAAKTSAAASKETEESGTRIKALEAELAQANEQREKLLVDFKNTRDRVLKDTEFKLFKEKEKFFQNFLPVLDGFERAGQSMNEATSAQSLLEGFSMLHGLLVDAVEQAGLDKINTKGSFDPRFHEAVGEVETQEKADDHIYDVLSSGYKLGERVIRAAMVRLARNLSGYVIPKEGAEPEEAPAEAAEESAEPSPAANSEASQE